MLEMIMVPFSHLVLLHREIGVHRGRTWGFRDVFGFRTLRDVPFVTLASKVKNAYEGRDVPSHNGWPAQHEALRWLVEKGHDGIYTLDEQGIKLISSADVLDARRIKHAASRLDALDPDLPLNPSQIARSTEEGIKLADSPDALDEGIKLRIKRTDSRSDELDGKLTASGPNVLDEGIQLAGSPERYYISDGHHRALALYTLGEGDVRARVLSKEEVRARVLSKEEVRSHVKS